MKTWLISFLPIALLLSPPLSSIARPDEPAEQRLREREQKQPAAPEGTLEQARDPEQTRQNVQEQQQEQTKQQEQAATQVRKRPQQKTQKQAQKEPKKQPAMSDKTDSTGDTPFVDRDGDGIQDGKEHRFRGHHRRRRAGGRDRGKRRHHGRQPGGNAGRNP